MWGESENGSTATSDDELCKSGRNGAMVDCEYTSERRWRERGRRNNAEVTDESLAQAARVIRDGGLVVIPTDTVYGVACDPRNKAAIDRIYRLKRRPRYKALQVLLASTDQLDELGLDLPCPAESFVGGVSAWRVLADCRSPARLHVGRLWPTPPMVGPGTQGIRIPNSALCLAILKATGPLAASSANRSGDESAQTVQEAVDAFGSEVDLYLDGGPTQGHVSSTVVKADPYARDGIEILREGVIAQNVIRKALHLNGGGLGA